SNWTNFLAPHDWFKRAETNNRSSCHLQAGRERPDFRIAAILSAETLYRHCRFACTNRAFLPASSARRCASSVGCRATHFFLAGTAWPEGSAFSDLQISNVKSAVLLDLPPGPRPQTTFHHRSMP